MSFMNEWGYWQREIATMKYEKKETENKVELLIEGGCAAAGHSNTKFQKAVQAGHQERKDKYTRTGGNKFRGAPFVVDPPSTRAYSAAPGYLEEENVEEDKLIPKKGKIKIRIKAKSHDKKHIDVLEEI
jgi:Tfp pilus assembly protein PilX